MLKKVAPLPWETPVKDSGASEKKATPEVNHGEKVAEAEKDSGPRSPARKKRKIRGFKEDPYLFFDSKEELWPPIK